MKLLLILYALSVALWGHDKGEDWDKGYIT